MYTVEKTQTDICLLKQNLEEIGEEVCVQRSILPKSYAENEKNRRETQHIIKNLRLMNTETERLNLESVKLTAERAQLKQQSDEISDSLTTACAERANLTATLEQYEQDILDHIRKYEDILHGRAEQFRKSHRYYDEEEINKEIDEVNTVIAELKDGMSKKQSAVDGLRARLDAIHPEVSENILEQMGKLELEEKLKKISEKHDELFEKRKNLVKQT